MPGIVKSLELKLRRREVLVLPRNCYHPLTETPKSHPNFLVSLVAEDIRMGSIAWPLRRMLNCKAINLSYVRNIHPDDPIVLGSLGRCLSYLWGGILTPVGGHTRPFKAVILKCARVRCSVTLVVSMDRICLPRLSLQVLVGGWSRSTENCAHR